MLTNQMELWQNNSPIRVELKNAHFIDILRNRYYKEGSRVIVYQGRIEQIAEGQEPLPEEAGISLDLGGKTVMPGLFNTHCHIQMTLPDLITGMGDLLSNKLHCSRQIEKNMLDCVLHGVTHIRDVWTDDLSRNRQLKARIDSGSLIGPRIHQCILIGPENGNMTTRRNRFTRTLFALRNMPTLDFNHPDSGVIALPAHAGLPEIRHGVDLAMERGAGYIKLYEQKREWFSGNFNPQFMTQEQLNALVDYAHSRGIKTTMHQVSVESFRRALAAGVWSLAHLPNDDILTKKDIQSFLDSGSVLEPTVSVLYCLCWRVAGDELQDHENMAALTDFREKTYGSVSEPFWLKPYHRRLMKGFEKLDRGHFRMFGALNASALFRVYARSIVTCLENLQRLVKAGAPVGCGNDAGAVCITEGMIGLELELMNLFLGFGGNRMTLTGLETLKAATINSARAMGLEKDYGSIDAGKVADLVVVDGDPLKDGSVVGKKADAVFMGGRLVVPITRSCPWLSQRGSGLRPHRHSGMISSLSWVFSPGSRIPP